MINSLQGIRPLRINITGSHISFFIIVDRWETLRIVIRMESS